MAKIDSSRLEPPRAVLFDAYGTLFDVYSNAQLAEQLFPGHGQLLSVLWRGKQIEYTRLVTTSSHGAHYQPFWDLTRAALVYAIKTVVAQADATGAGGQFGINFQTRYGAPMERLLDQYRHPEQWRRGQSARHLGAWRLVQINSNALLVAVEHGEKPGSGSQ